MKTLNRHTQRSSGLPIRTGWIAVLWCVCFCVVAGRLLILQVFQQEPLSRRAERQQIRTVELNGQRGSLYDRQGRMLAMNLDVPSIYAVPPLIKDPHLTAIELSRVLGKEPDLLERRLRSEKEFVWIERRVDPAAAKSLEELGLDGIGFLQESQRFYPKRGLMGHLLGFAGMDNQGLEGIERAYDATLRGRPSRIRLSQDAIGRPMLLQWSGEMETVLPDRGNDVVLTIDETIQHIAERELAHAVEETGATSGSAVVMDPHTGAILALAVSPDFNPNAIQEARPDRWRNRATADAYEPGSTMKMFVAAAALEEGVVRPDDPINCEQGLYRVANHVIHDRFKERRLTFQEVLRRSSNIGMVKVGMEVGGERLHRYLRAFGFGEKTGIDLYGEAAGLLRPPQQWSKLSLASLSMGQEISVTPIQLAAAASAIANGGLLVRPHLVSEIRDPEGRIVRRFEPEVRGRVISRETSRTLVRMLESVVEKGGTGERAGLTGYRVAGKTGTAQKLDAKTGRYSEERFVTSFLGFTPTENPRLVILVVLDEPEGKEVWGGSTAAPVFRRIAEQALPYLGIPADRTPAPKLVTERAGSA
jgi:cell division protein FtsI (penicillin-binding protein 3)